MIRIAFCLLLLCCESARSSVFADEPHRLDWSNLSQDSNQLEVTSGDGIVSLLTVGEDPYFRFSIPKLERTDRDWILEFQYFCPQGVSGLEWRIGSGIHKAEAAALPAMAASEGWTTYALNLSEISADEIRSDTASRARIDLGNTARVRLQIRNVIVRLASDAEVAKRNADGERRLAKQRLAGRIESYQSRQWPARIVSVSHEGPHFKLTGRIDSAASLTGLFAIARHPQSVSADHPTSGELRHKWTVKIDNDGRTIRAMIPNAELPTGLASFPRFQLCARSDAAIIVVSPAFCVGPAPVTAPRVADPSHQKSLHAAKGLTCITSRFSPDQLRELGLEHASVNLVLSGLVSETKLPGWESREINGRTWWVNEQRLRRNDRDIRTIVDAGASAAGILLIPAPKRHPSPIAHPESTTAGTYAMPNLTSRQSVERYAAILEILGERYGGSHAEHGRIDHWIVHNEVDYGWQWTNMGEQPMEVFMDHYVRSMRMVDAAARRHHPEARVFISLTHRWNTPRNQHWKTYAPKAMLDWLLQSSRLEGDFPWGVAYHPYPQSLWKADFWNDSRVTDDFDTELITMKNLQVLDRFLHLSSSRTADGLVRPVICSEQGFHADPNDPKQLRNQAAALLLTWEKLRDCPSILAFDYHRPSDHPREGGLRLGLRGLPTKSNPLGEPKPAWGVYSAIGTEREAALIDQYRTVWESQSPQ